MADDPKGTPPRRHEHAAVRVYEGEAFIVLPEVGEFKILNKVGSRVWELIDGARSSVDIAGAIAEEYDVSADTALKDVNEFLQELRTNGMLAKAGRVA